MIFNARPHTAAAVSTLRSSYIVGCKDAELVCYFGLENLRTANSVWHFDNESNVSEKETLVSARAPSDILGANLICIGPCITFITEE